MYDNMTCPRAKLLAGSLMCPCHGTVKPSRRRSGAPPRGQSKAAAKEEMMAGLVRTLKQIRSATHAHSEHV